MLQFKTLCRCMLLILAAWPGPRPVVHSHDEYFQQPGGVCVLARHAALHHRSSCTSETETNESHCHWLFSGFACDRTLAANEGQIAVADGDRLAPEPFDFPGVTADSSLAQPLLVPNDRVERFTGFFEVRAAGLAFCQHLCIWIC